MVIKQRRAIHSVVTYNSCVSKKKIWVSEDFRFFSSSRHIVLNLYCCDSSPITTACFTSEMTFLLSPHICSSPFADCKWEAFFKHINIGHSWWVKCFWITSDENVQLPDIQKGTQQNVEKVCSWEVPCFQEVFGTEPLTSFVNSRFIGHL